MSIIDGINGLDPEVCLIASGNARRHIFIFRTANYNRFLNCSESLCCMCIITMPINRLPQATLTNTTTM